MKTFFLSFILCAGTVCGVHFAKADGSAITAGIGSGAAAGVPSLPDPQTNPVEAVTTAWGVVHQYGWLWGSMIVLFGGGALIIKFNDSTHWLSQDHVLPFAVGALGTLGAALQAHFAGGSWAGVVATGFAAIMLLIQKPTPGKQLQLQSQKGFARLGLVLAMAVNGVVLVACLSTGQKAAVKAGGSASEACVLADVKAYAGELVGDLSTAGYDAAIAGFAASYHFGQDAINCLIKGVVAMVTSEHAGSAQHGQPTPAIANGKAYLDAHGGAP